MSPGRIPSLPPDLQEQPRHADFDALTLHFFFRHRELGGSLLRLPEHLQRDGGNLRRVVVPFGGNFLHRNQVRVVVAFLQPLADVVGELRPTAGRDIGGGGNAGRFDRGVDGLFDKPQLVAFAGRNQRNCFAGTSGPSGAPDAVNVTFYVPGNIVIL